jgi:alkyl sulfatase BDS1-like metallo-beta-lactamase superfamily hydrolase
LKPAGVAERGREIAALAGGVDKVVARAMEKLNAGDLAMAMHLIDWAVAAAPDNAAAHEARIKIFETCAERSASTMSHGIYRSAARTSAKRIKKDPPPDKRSF